MQATDDTARYTWGKLRVNWRTEWRKSGEEGAEAEEEGMEEEQEEEDQSTLLRNRASQHCFP